MIDLLIIFLLIVAFWSGYRIGAVKLLGSMCGMLVGLLGCHLAGSQCADIAMRWIESPTEAAIVAYTVLFVVLWLSAGLIFSAAKKVLKALHLGKIDSILGSVMLGLMTLAGMSVTLNVWVVLEPRSEILAEGGSMMNSVSEFAPWLLGYLSAGNI